MKASELKLTKHAPLLNNEIICCIDRRSFSCQTFKWLLPLLVVCRVGLGAPNSIPFISII